ncbi:TPA: hypothetical protein RHY09_001142 [Escherichia coli]|nr:hypothetical protein [Escherichia coli]EHS0230701.1 hypothetical protein [Escherichia coli]EIW8248628.1 hypothetical protein [Escherichia coli]HDV1336391.1 hypothetical protein [Escherichia coli]HDV1355220.1 hypothetical protein [Escherichia coli]
MSRGLDELVKRVQEMGRLKAEVGWMDTAKYPDGTPVALVAQTQEYGSPARHIPPRPFVRPTVAAEKGNWSRQMGIGVRAVASGAHSAEQVFVAIGELADGDVRMTITQISSPPLEDSTQNARAARGLEPEKPLQATGLMLASCTSLVKEK